jgi:hypothetical protein
MKIIFSLRIVFTLFAVRRINENEQFRKRREMKSKAISITGRGRP